MVASIEAKVVTESQEIEYAFELLDIPLTNYNSMPEAIEPLKITGDVPARVEWESIVEGEFKNQKEAKFRITNFTNKAIRFVELELTGADSGGNADRATLYTFYPRFVLGDKAPPKVVDPNTIASFVIPEMVLPYVNHRGGPLTRVTKADATVAKIGFADSTVWPDTTK